VKRCLLFSLALTFVCALAFGYVGFLRTDWLLEKIPTHWNINMQPDQWTDREHFVWYLLIAPSVMLLMVLLMMVLPLISPKNFEIERFAGTFGFVMTSLVVYFAYVGLLILWAGVVEDPPYWSNCFVCGIFALFAVMGNVMGKVKRNFWMGVRTPWTLASETVWDRTHRVAAWLWTGVGVVGAIAVLCGVPFWIALIVLFAAALWPVVYSLILYKSLEKSGKLLNEPGQPGA
jgi:uncharacterized membrane protein